jgi:hypothetical protein
MKRFKVGETVRISDGSGIDSGKLARVVSWDEIIIDGTGIPINIPGAYKPADPYRETPLQFLEYPGRFGLMFNNRLQLFREYKNEVSANYWHTWEKLND